MSIILPLHLYHFNVFNVEYIDLKYKFNIRHLRFRKFHANLNNDIKLKLNDKKFKKFVPYDISQFSQFDRKQWFQLICNY